jgi:hypothetical protein
MVLFACYETTLFGKENPYDLQPVRLAGGRWLVLICSEKKVLSLVVDG